MTSTKETEKLACDIKVRVYGERLLVAFDDLAEEQVITDGAGRTFTVKVPEQHSERTRIATILDVGTGPDATQYKAGERILVSWHSGVRLHLLDKLLMGRSWKEDLLRVITPQEVLLLVTEETPR